MEKFDNINISHITRGKNSSADALAKLAAALYCTDDLLVEKFFHDILQEMHKGSDNVINFLEWHIIYRFGAFKSNKIQRFIAKYNIIDWHDRLFEALWAYRVSSYPLNWLNTELSIDAIFYPVFYFIIISSFVDATFQIHKKSGLSEKNQSCIREIFTPLYICMFMVFRTQAHTSYYLRS
ncbi:hypothetical protein ACJX0J_015268, partial [Zea mays]